MLGWCVWNVFVGWVGVGLCVSVMVAEWRFEFLVLWLVWSWWGFWLGVLILVVLLWSDVTGACFGCVFLVWWFFSAVFEQCFLMQLHFEYNIKIIINISGHRSHFALELNCHCCKSFLCWKTIALHDASQTSKIPRLRFPRGFQEVSERFRKVSKMSPRGFREVSERFREVSKRSPRGSERFPRDLREVSERSIIHQSMGNRCMSSSGLISQSSFAAAASCSIFSSLAGGGDDDSDIWPSFRRLRTNILLNWLSSVRMSLWVCKDSFKTSVRSSTASINSSMFLFGLGALTDLASSGLSSGTSASPVVTSPVVDASMRSQVMKWQLKCEHGSRIPVFDPKCNCATRIPSITWDVMVMGDGRISISVQIFSTYQFSTSWVLGHGWIRWP